MMSYNTTVVSLRSGDLCWCHRREMCQTRFIDCSARAGELLKNKRAGNIINSGSSGRAIVNFFTTSATKLGYVPEQ